MSTGPRKNYSSTIIAITFLISLGYAIVRYHILGPIPWKDLPFFVLNKGVALSSLFILAINFSLSPLTNLGVRVPEGWLNGRKEFGRAGIILVLIHVLMSFLIFNKATFEKFYEDNGTLTFFTGLSMIGGVLSFVILWGYNWNFQILINKDQDWIKFTTSRNFLLSAMLFALIHLYFMGVEGWKNVDEWHSGLPPISLIAFITFSIGLIINVLGRK